MSNIRLLLLTLFFSFSVFSGGGEEQEESSIPASLPVDPDAFKASVKAKNPGLFKGDEPDLWSSVKEYRDLEQGPSVLPHYLFGNKEARAIQLFKDQTQKVGISVQGSSVVEVYGSIFQALAQASINENAPTDLEEDVFSNLPNNGKFYRFYKNKCPVNKGINPLVGFVIGASSYQDTYAFDEEDGHIGWSSALAIDAHHVSDHLDTLDPRFVRFLSGAGEIGLASITEWCVHDVFAVGLSPSKAYVHGMPMSPLALAVHDLEHADALENGRHFQQMVFDSLANLKAEEFDVMKFLTAPLAVDSETKEGTLVQDLYVQRYHRVMTEVFQAVFDRIVYDVLPQRGEAECMKLLVPFFVMMHEQAYIDPSVYALSSPAAAFSKVVESSKDFIEGLASINRGGIETPFNYGSATQTDSEILKTTFLDVKNRMIARGKYYQDLEDDERFCEWIVKELSSYKILRGPANTRLELQLKDGFKTVIAYPTNHFQWLFNKDTKKLLELSGVQGMQEPTLVGGAEDFDIVEAYYAQLKSEFSALFDNLEAYADGILEPFSSEYAAEVRAEEWMLKAVAESQKEKAKAQEEKNKVLFDF